MRDSHRRRRETVRFRPIIDPAGEGGTVLDCRLLLSADAIKGVHASPHGVHARPLAHHATRSASTSAASSRTTPAQQINKQYEIFIQNFQTVEAAYVQSLNQQSSGTVAVSTTLTAPYLAGSAAMQVQDAAVFGPEGTYSTPVTATALVGSVPVGTFTLIGSSGNVLAINTTQSSAVSLGTGTILTAQVTSSASTSAGTIFPSYITASTQQLAVNLVSYFNNLPIKLPRKFAFPHQRQSKGAIQQYVYQVAVGTSPTSLEQSLLAVPLPLTPGGDLQIYDDTIATDVNASRLRMLNGVEQIFANKLPIIPQGTTGFNSTSGTGTSSSTSSSGTGSTGSSTSGTA